MDLVTLGVLQSPHSMAVNPIAWSRCAAEQRCQPERRSRARNSLKTTRRASCEVAESNSWMLKFQTYLEHYGKRQVSQFTETRKLAQLCRIALRPRGTVPVGPLKGSIFDKVPFFYKHRQKSPKIGYFLICTIGSYPSFSLRFENAHFLVAFGARTL